MIKFWTYRYELTPWGSLGSLAEDKPRMGALLKCQWPNQQIGYADIFPWPELGDADLDDQISALARGRLSPLLEQSVWLAKKDAALRNQQKNAFAAAPKIKNHYLINDFSKFTDANMKEVRTAGFTTLKIKVGRSVNEEAKFVSRTLKQNPVVVRLDFNGKVDFSEFERFTSHLDRAEKARIEYVEDPIPWDLDGWTEAAKLLPVALDHEYHRVVWEKFTGKPPFVVVVLKPARQDIDKALKWINRFALKMTVSSALDHPVGMAHATLVATELKKFYPNTLLDCSTLTMRAYKPNEFSNRIQMTGPFLKEIPGTGIGFNDLLDKVEWIQVVR